MNKLIEVHDAGDSFTIATRLYLSFNVSKLDVKLSRADIIALATAKLQEDIARAISLAALQVRPEIDRLMAEAEAEATKVAEAA